MNRREFTLAATAFLATPYIARAQTGVTSTEILIGNTSPQSGTASAAGIVAKSTNAYFNFINEQGGINGRKIRFLMLDDGYNPTRTVELARQLVEKEQVLATVGTTGTAPNSAIQRYMNRSKVPHLFVNSGASRFGDYTNYPWTMGWQPTGVSAAKAFVQHILETRPDAKIAILFQNDDFGKDYVKGAREALGEKADRMIVSQVSYEVTDPTIDSQMVSLMSSGADTFINVSIPKFALQSIKKAGELNWRPTHYMTEAGASVGLVMQPAGPDNTAGIITAAFSKDPTEPQWQQGPEWEAYVGWQKKYFSEGNIKDAYMMTGYSIGQTFIKVLEQAGNDLSRENLMKQAANLDMTLPMLLPGIRIKTAPDDYYPIESVQLLKFNGQNYERFGRVYGKQG
jgi:branched-chain amino acid transport system substrate-binding protein